MTMVAILDSKNRLIGLRKLSKRGKVSKGEVEVADECDLPTDGTYKWMAEDMCFMPVGHGLGKPGPAPISSEQVIFLLASSMDNLPQEILDWMKWYKGLSES